MNQNGTRELEKNKCTPEGNMLLEPDFQEALCSCTELAGWFCFQDMGIGLLELLTEKWV